MSDTKAESALLDGPEESVDRKRSWLAAGGVLGALLASTCCIAPLALLTLGVSGAWIGNLTAFEPYKPIFAAIALVFVVLGFREVYFKTKPACVEGTYCRRPQSVPITKAALWLAAVLVILALTITWWAPLFY